MASPPFIFAHLLAVLGSKIPVFKINIFRMHTAGDTLVCHFKIDIKFSFKKPRNGVYSGDFNIVLFLIITIPPSV